MTLYDVKLKRSVEEKYAHINMAYISYIDVRSYKSFHNFF